MRGYRDKGTRVSLSPPQDDQSIPDPFVRLENWERRDGRALFPFPELSQGSLLDPGLSSSTLPRKSRIPHFRESMTSALQGKSQKFHQIPFILKPGQSCDYSYSRLCLDAQNIFTSTQIIPKPSTGPGKNKSLGSVEKDGIKSVACGIKNTLLPSKQLQSMRKMQSKEDWRPEFSQHCCNPAGISIILPKNSPEAPRCWEKLESEQ